MRHRWRDLLPFFLLRECPAAAFRTTRARGAADAFGAARRAAARGRPARGARIANAISRPSGTAVAL